MNASEFERNKPRKTYQAIKNLKDYLMMMSDCGETKVNISNVLDGVFEIEDKFLNGE